jgi:transketolase
MQLNFNSGDKRCLDTIRILSSEMVDKAKSGHPGAPIGMAPGLHVLFSRILKFGQDWVNRDRFVLSNGHASAGLYTMLHLIGFLNMEDLRNFRVLGSRTAGHPENVLTPGVEVTTGPLGQGLAQAVGLALAECRAREEFGAELVNNYTYCYLGDGCLQEGITSEVSSFAGHNQLHKLIVLFDDNDITLDGPANLSVSENITQRYDSYGWEVLVVEDGDQDLEGIYAALLQAQSSTKPTLIRIKSTIGYMTSKAGTSKAHGAPLGPEETEIMRAKWGNNEPFSVPDEVKQIYDTAIQRNGKLRGAWDALKKPDDFVRRMSENPLAHLNLQQVLPDFTKEHDLVATRSYSLKCLEALGAAYPELIGGSADLSCSNLTKFTNSNRHIYYGVREHGMFGISNGISAYGLNYRPFASTFLNFISYGWGAVRLSALSEFPVIYVMTHDSLELGEDGPTHTPIEVLPMIRATPNLIDLRPMNGTETGMAYEVAMGSTKQPVVICCARSTKAPITPRDDRFFKGAYPVSDFSESGKPKVVLSASGWEVTLCLQAKEQLKDVCDVRVNSCPSWYLFAEQSPEYRREILPSEAIRFYVEASSEFGMERFGDHFIGMTCFGGSGHESAVRKEFGFTPENICSRVRALL